MNAPLPPRVAAPDARLDELAAQVERIILARQDPRSGLLPASTAVTVHGDYTHAWVRDNVYSILAPWALALALRGRDAARAAAFEDAVVRLMRGLLAAMMRQAHKVERFKHTQDPLDALHAKYDTASGEPVVGDGEWGHLQIDATALFVLQLAQMSASGLAIVRTADELAFVQNLVHYLAKAHRTPDYGIWERGHKRNEGVAELNASSLGMAKAALEAIAGFDPLPGGARAIHVCDDDIARSREALAGLLPRESESKETDAALLAIAGYPAFAIDDPALAERTRAVVLERLIGRHGGKRFLRDGHQTVLEDASRLHYEPGELQRFAHIESEWPLFLTYLLIDAALRGDPAAAAHWRTRLDALRQERDGDWLLPELYVVPAGSVEAERAAPGSQARVPNENVPLVWAQSLYIVGMLLHEGLLDAAALDPLGRRAGARTEAAPVQLVLLAEDELVRARLAAQGIAAATLDGIAPLGLLDAAELEAAFAGLGRCDALGLSGRPRHGLGSLATSRVFVRGDARWLCLPPFAARAGFYLALDNRLLVDEVRSELAWLRRHWRGSGRPLLPLLVGTATLDAPGADALLAFLAGLGRDGATAIGTLPDALARAAVCRLDGLLLPQRGAGSAAVAPVGAAAPVWDEAATRPLAPSRAAAIAAEHDPETLRRQFARSRNPYEQVDLLAALWRRAGPDAGVDGADTVAARMAALYAQACRQRRWGVLRRAAGWLEVHDSGLEEAVARLVAHGKRVALGRGYSAAAVVARPLGDSELHRRLREHGGEDARGRVLIEELVLLLGLLVKADAALIDGTLTLRPWQALLLLTARLAREHELTQAEAFDHLLELSPRAILERLREALADEAGTSATLGRVQALRDRGGSALVEVVFPPEDDPTRPEGGWAAWRETMGVLTRVPPDFHARVWALLQHADGLVIGDQLDACNRLDSALARADSTPHERSFALQVDDLLERIHAPEYRQLVVEALLALSAMARANPALRIEGLLVLDVVIGTAVRLGWMQGAERAARAAYREHVAQAWGDFYASAPHRVATLLMAAVGFLLGRRAG